MIVEDIIVEDSLTAIIATIPAIRIHSSLSKKPSFGWGNKAELARYLKLKKDAAYPLIWLLPSEDNHSSNGQQCDKDCVFILATREIRQDMFNDQRYKKTFAATLNPLSSLFIHGLSVSTISNVDSREWTKFKFPNYVEADKNYTIDLWDAIQLTISVRFNNTSNCLKSISYGEL